MKFIEFYRDQIYYLGIELIPLFVKKYSIQSENYSSSILL